MMPVDRQVTIPSPCVRNCCLDDNDACFGCFRTLAEIKEWGTADDVRRLVILDNARLRRPRVGRRKGEL